MGVLSNLLNLEKKKKKKKRKEGGEMARGDCIIRKTQLPTVVCRGLHKHGRKRFPSPPRKENPTIACGKEKNWFHPGGTFPYSCL